MRIGGAFLLIVGLFLCLTIVWAAVGFLMMGLGLACFLVAERREKRNVTAKVSTALKSSEADRRKEPELHAAREANQLTASRKVANARHEPTFFAGAAEVTPSAQSSQPAASLSPATAQQRPAFSVEAASATPTEPPSISQRRASQKKRASRPQIVSSAHTYDFEKWRTIAKDDADISRSVEAVAAFGKKYVDLLASAYLAFNDKSYLPVIMKMVAETIRKDSGRVLAGAATEGDSKMDLISFALSKTRALPVDALLALPAFETSPTRVDSARALREVESKSPYDLKEPRLAPRRVVADRAGATSAAKPTADGQATSRPAGPIDADETRNLTELFNKIT